MIINSGGEEENKENDKRKMNQKAYEEIVEEINNCCPIKGLRNKIEFYSSEELLSLGRDYVNKSKYLEANIVFAELFKIKEYRELSDLYQYLTLSLGAIKFREMIHSKGYDSKPIMKAAIYCMKKSATMYAKKEISKDDLITIETLIDRIPFGKLIIKDKVEFERIYSKFKEFSLDAFLDDKEKEKKE